MHASSCLFFFFFLPSSIFHLYCTVFIVYSFKSTWTIRVKCINIYFQQLVFTREKFLGPQVVILVANSGCEMQVKVSPLSFSALNEPKWHSLSQKEKWGREDKKNKTKQKNKTTKTSACSHTREGERKIFDEIYLLTQSKTKVHLVLYDGFQGWWS